MELPEALSTDNPGHAQTIYQAIETSTQSPIEEERKPAERVLKACQEIPGYTSILATIAATHAASTDARAAAVILLKNMVRVRWKSRGARNVMVGDGEKAALRGALLGAAMMEEPQARVASQLGVLIGKIARVDWPRQWPELFPSLVTSLVSGGSVRRRMALCAINEVLKELSTKRIGFDKAAFIKTSHDLLPVLCQAWDAQWALIEAALTPAAAAAAAAAGAVVAATALGSEGAAGTVAVGTVCVKIIRRLLQFGIPGLDHPHVEPYFFGLLQRMPTVLATLTTFATPPAGVGVGGMGGVGVAGGGGEGVMEELEELAERMAGTAVDAQKGHPIGFRRYLSAYLSFFCEQLLAASVRPNTFVAAAAAAAAAAGVGAERAGASGGCGGCGGGGGGGGGAGGRWDRLGAFCIQGMGFVGNVVGCSSYREEVLRKAAMSASASVPRETGSGPPRLVGRLITGKGDATITPETAHEISSTMVEFFSAERVVGLLKLLLDGFLPLTAAEVEEWRDDPEGYYLEQESLEASESVRVSAQQLYMALLEAGGRNVGDVIAAAVAKMLSQGVSDQIEASRQTTISPQVLAYDALYRCAGLGAYTVKQHFDFQGWFQAVLAPALEALDSTMRSREHQEASGAPPLILQRRLMWLLGCWAEQIPPSLRPHIVQATGNVIKAKGADVVVQLAALNALHSLLSLWDLDVSQCLAPALGWLLPALYSMFDDVTEMDSRQQVLTVMSELMERSGRLLVPHCQAAVTGLPRVWLATASQTPLRCACLQMMTHVVDALGSNKGPDLDSAALAMVDVATNVGSDESIYLMEAGLELWLALLRHMAEYGETVHKLFPRIAEMLRSDLDYLKQAMLIMEAYVVIGGTVFLQEHGPLVCACFSRVVGQVKPQGAAFVSRALESLLRKFPADSSRMLADGGVIRQVVGACAAGGGEGGAREPDIVIVQHLTILCRVLLGAPEVLLSVLDEVAAKSAASAREAGNGTADGPDKVLVDLVGQMTALFDSAGYSSTGIWRRRLWAMALLKLLPSANGGIVSSLDQIVNICVDVLTEEVEDGGKKLKDSLHQSPPSDEVADTSCPPYLLQSKLQEELRTDVAVTTDLRVLVRGSMDALRAVLGDAGWKEAVETLEPAVFSQLGRMVA